MTQKAVCGHSHDGRRRTARAAGLPTVVGGRIGLLPVALTPAVSAGRPSCVADRTDPCRAQRLTGHLRCPQGPRWTDPRARTAGRPQPGRIVDGAGSDQGAAGHPPSSAPSRDTDGRRSGRADVHPRGAKSVVVTDITEHRTYEGKVYCAVVLDTFSRRVVGWSIDSSQTAALVSNALSMAIANRDPQGGGIIHSDHGVQGGFK